MMIPKRNPIRLNKIRDAARRADCMMESPACNGNPETVVFCHLNYGWAGKGMSQKADDTAGFFACADCHTWYDQTLHADDALPYAFRACVRTWRWLVESGVLK